MLVMLPLCFGQAAARLDQRRRKAAFYLLFCLFWDACVWMVAGGGGESSVKNVDKDFHSYERD